MTRSARRVVVLICLVVLATTAASARAHGDPASDVLIEQKVYFPYGGGSVSKGSQSALKSVVQQANERGYKIKVAVIGAQLDLGDHTNLWLKPQIYAKFLGGELLFVYKKGRLLIVMPNGFGLFRGAKRESAILKRIATGRNADDLVKAATVAVERLAAASGVEVKPQRAGGSSSSGNRLAIALGGVAILALLGLMTYVCLPRRRSRAATTPSHEAEE